MRSLSTPTCSFCHRKPDEVPHLVISDRGIAVCLACARRCVGICEAADAPHVSRLPRAEQRVPRPVRVPDTRHLDAFLSDARCGGYAGTPEPVMPWLREFLDAYETAVLDAVRDTAALGEGLVRSNHVLGAFDALMKSYRGDRRRAYLGAAFDRLLGRSIREGFAYHVDTTVLAQVEGAAA